MFATEVPHGHASSEATDLKLEVIAIPVADVDRAKDFYLRLGWRLDADFSNGNARAIQFTPPGSGCSVHFGTNVTPAEPGSAKGMFLVVSDIESAREQLQQRGVQVSEVFHYSEGPGPFGEMVRGPAPDHQTYASFATFSDPDGNLWVLQEVTSRLPGRVESDATSFASASDLASAFRRAAAAHHEYETRLGHPDEDWPGWYARYVAAEQHGEQLPS